MDPKKPRGSTKNYQAIKKKANYPFEKPPSTKLHFNTSFQAIRKPFEKQQPRSGRLGQSGSIQFRYIHDFCPFQLEKKPPKQLISNMKSVPCELSPRWAPVFWSTTATGERSGAPQLPWPRCLPTTFARRCLRGSDIPCCWDLVGNRGNGKAMDIINGGF